MKSGLATILAVARSWAYAPGSGTLVVAFTCDEEHASLGMQALVRDGLEADAAVVTEPTGLAVMPAHKGFQWVEVTFRGRAAHGSRPEVGVDAIRHAGALLQEMDSLEVGLRNGEPHRLRRLNLVGLPRTMCPHPGEADPPRRAGRGLPGGS
jgi:acetylornithine deacetylase